MTHIKEGHLKAILPIAQDYVSKHANSARPMSEYLLEDIELAKKALEEKNESAYEEIFFNLGESVGLHDIHLMKF